MRAFCFLKRFQIAVWVLLKLNSFLKRLNAEIKIDLRRALRTDSVQLFMMIYLFFSVFIHVMFGYDDMDGLTKVTYPDGSYVSYSYDNSCRLTSIDTAYGTTEYSYDKLDRLVKVVDRNGYATVYEYDENGNRSAVKYANGIVVSYKYDEVNRLISEKALDKDGGLVAQYEYTLGAAGERTRVTELDRTVEYTYDELYRLTSETITGVDGSVNAYTYAYDAVSNRISKTENDNEIVYTYNELNQLISENDITYEYDAAGNLVYTDSLAKSATNVSLVKQLNQILYFQRIKHRPIQTHLDGLIKLGNNLIKNCLRIGKIKY